MPNPLTRLICWLRGPRNWIAHSLFWWRHDWLLDEKDCSRCGKRMEEPKHD